MNNEIIKYLALGALGGSLFTGTVCYIKSKPQDQFVSSSLSQEERDIQDFLKDFVELKESIDTKLLGAPNIILLGASQTKSLFKDLENKWRGQRQQDHIFNKAHVRSIKKKINNEWEVVWEYKSFQNEKELIKGFKKSLIKVAFDPTFSYLPFDSKGDSRFCKIHNPQGLHVTDYVVEEVSP